MNGGGASNSLPLPSCGTASSSGGKNRHGWKIDQVIRAIKVTITWHT